MQEGSHRGETIRRQRSLGAILQSQLFKLGLSVQGSESFLKVRNWKFLLRNIRSYLIHLLKITFIVAIYSEFLLKQSIIYYRTGTQSYNQMGYSKVRQRGLQPGGQVHRRVLWIWTLPHQGNCRGAGPGEGIFATGFRKTWQLGKWFGHAHQTLD